MEIVVPTHYYKNDFSEFLTEKRRWIEKHLHVAQLEQQQRSEQALPEMLKLSAIHEQWRINYITQLSNKFHLMLRPHNEIVLLGNPKQPTKYYAILKKWLRQYSSEKLIFWLDKISHEIQLPYKSVTIRGQTTCWGGCTIQHTIALNFKLLFLQPELVRYVIIHELCHTVHLSHSERFWQLVANFDANWKIHKEQLRHTRREIPLWLE